MKASDKIFSAVVLGLITPVTLMLLFWWGSIPFVKDNALIAYLALAGFLTGVILDATILRKFIMRIFCLSMPVLVAVLLFYSVMFFGFFMGFPVFNALLGIAASFVAARGVCLYGIPPEKAHKNLRVVRISSFLVLFILCIITAVLTLNETTITSQLRSMLGLSFEVTMGMVWGAILVGGILLLFLQDLIERVMFKRIAKC